MKQQRAFVGVGLALCLAALGGGYWLGAARADGIPTMEALAYSGELTDSGAPASGAHMIGVSLWSDASSTTTTFRACDTPASSITVTAGRFRVPLDATCVQAVHDHPDLWAQVTVAGTPLVPRTHIAAAPYAVEADHVATTRANWCAVTGATYTGSLTSGGLTGYRAGGRICQTECGSPTAHICGAAELTRNAQIEHNPFGATGYAWYASGIRGSSEPVTDCHGFLLNASESGTVWNLDQDAPTNAVCSSSYQIVCCD